MTHQLVCVFGLALAACSSNGSTGSGGTDAGSDPSGQGCISDDCVCTTDQTCSRECTPNAAACDVQGSSSAVNVQCDHNGKCHVECASATSCAVACGGSTDCEVTCPAAGCTVSECVGSACIVTCGTTGVATRNGTTATCP